MRINVFIFFVSFNCYCQFKIFDFYSKEKIDSVVFSIYSNKDTLSYINERTPILHLDWKVIKKIKFSHVAYEDIFLGKKLDTIFLINKNCDLEEVILTNKKNDKKLLKNLIKPFVNYTHNLGFNDKFVSLFKTENKKINEISLEIINTLEVKNTKFLPFKIVIYSKDTNTDYPNDLIFQSEIVRKENNNKYFTYNISHLDLIKNFNEIFIGIEILDENNYYPKKIYSKYGFVDATPSIEAEIYDELSYQKTYEYQDHLKKWSFCRCHLKIKLKYEK